MKSNRKTPIILMIISILIGFVALLASLGGLMHVVGEAGYRSTTGVVTDLDKQNVGNKIRTNMRCSPIVEYSVDGKSYSHGPDQYAVYGKGTECKYSVGENIEVRYDPSNPSESTVSDSTFDWMMGLIGAAVAVIFGLMLPIRLALGRSTKSEVASSGDYTQG